MKTLDPSAATIQRTGLGFDTHRLGTGRPLIIGGVTIPHELGLLGCSDADVLAHAISDALLGAIAAGDIGQHFPDTDPQWQNADSIALLRRVVALLDEHGWAVVNVDATIVAEAPKMAPHIPAMRANLSQALNVAIDRISVKATTVEKLGAIGRCEGISTIAVANVVRINKLQP